MDGDQCNLGFQTDVMSIHARCTPIVVCVIPHAKTRSPDQPRRSISRRWLICGTGTLYRFFGLSGPTLDFVMEVARSQSTMAVVRGLSISGALHAQWCNDTSSETAGNGHPITQRNLFAARYCKRLLVMPLMASRDVKLRMICQLLVYA